MNFTVISSKYSIILSVSGYFNIHNML